MIGWFPDWQTTVAWLVVTAMASVIYFGSMTRVIDFGN
jgi:heme A synthase